MTSENREILQDLINLDDEIEQQEVQLLDLKIKKHIRMKQIYESALEGGENK